MLLCNTLPMTTLSISAAATPARSMAPLAATTPSCVAVVLRNAPPKVPTGVRAPSKITISRLNTVVHSVSYAGNRQQVTGPACVILLPVIGYLPSHPYQSSTLHYTQIVNGGQGVGGQGVGGQGV